MDFVFRLSRQAKARTSNDAYNALIKFRYFSKRSADRPTPKNRGAKLWKLKRSIILSERSAFPVREGCRNTRVSEAEDQLKKLSGWRITDDGQRIRKQWVVKNFMAGIKFFDEVARLAEEEQHHPDLHLEGYRNVAIELWTHAIGGLSENDFILAAKIDQLPIKLKS